MSLTKGLACLFTFAAAFAAPIAAPAESNVVIRVVTANLTSGNLQRYEQPGLHILKALSPDIVAVQEFNYASKSGKGTDSPAAIREMVDTAFGTNFVYYRESSVSIPNGVISRYPFIASGSWASDIDNRGYAWAQIDVPGSNDLYVVSVHLKASGNSAAKRAAEATTLRTEILANFPSNAWVIVAGDLNLNSDSEPAMTTFNTFLSDSPVPEDQDGNENTNSGRSKRYDRVLSSFSMTHMVSSVVLASNTFPKGLVFDSRRYQPLSVLSPVEEGDSAAANMQHMAVVKDFLIPVSGVATQAAGDKSSSP